MTNEMETIIGEGNENTPINVLHIPCNTPYVRKLQRNNELQIINGNYLGSSSIPIEITYQWISENREEAAFWNSFDICHIHYGFEFETFDVVKSTLKLLAQNKKPIVFTCHELSSMHGISREDYRQYLDLILESSSALITLTDEAKKILEKTHVNALAATVIPHGFVSIPEENLEKKRCDLSIPPEILLFGALRPNRDTATTLINTMLGTSKTDCRITLVTQPFTHQQLTDLPILRNLLGMIHSDTRLKIELTLPLTDEEVVNRVRQADIIVLPYLSAGHSGQLELAYDCGILPVFTNVGFLESQSEVWPENKSGVTNAVVADWSDGKHWLYQSRLLQALWRSLTILPKFGISTNLSERRSFRLKEHERVLEAHMEVYRKSLKKEQ